MLTIHVRVLLSVYGSARRAGRPGPVAAQRSAAQRCAASLADGVGARDPQPQELGRLVFYYNLQVNLAFSKLFIWVSSWGRGFPLSSVNNAALRSGA